MVGAGVVGLTCAVRLAEAGHRVDVLARDLPRETTSVVAAALWYPYKALPEDKVTAWGDRVRRLRRPGPAGRRTTGVRMLAGTEVLTERTPDPWWIEAVPSLDRADPLPGYADAWSFVAPVIDMPVYLDWLHARLESSGGTVTRMSLGGLPPVAPGSGDVVVNCAGIGARLLAADTSVHPVRGQVVQVRGVEVDRWWLDESGPTYVVPRSDTVVVGGTDDEGDWSRTPSPETAARILERAARLVPALARPRWSPTGSGCVPVRPEVRLEAVGRTVALLRPRRRRRHAQLGLRRRGGRAGRRASWRERTHSYPRVTTCGPCAAWHVSSRRSAWSASARWAPASRRCSRGTGTTSSASSVDEDGAERGRQHLEHSTARAVSPRQARPRRSSRRCSTGSPSPTSLKDLEPADLVVEAVVESLEVKKSIFKELDGHRPRGRHPGDQHLLALGHRDLHRQRPARAASSGCTSSTRRRCRASSRSCSTVVTEPDVLEDVVALVHALGKNPVVCGDKAGFIANTLLFGYLNHAVSMYENRYATREDIDAAMRFGCGYPMGPLALLDLIGLDTAYEILDTMYRQGRDRLHAPSPILKQMVTAGHARPQDRPRLLHLRGARQPGRGAPTTRRRRRPTSRSSSTTITLVGVVGTGTMATGIVEVFAKGGYDVLYVGRSQDKVDGVPRDDRALAGQGDPARQARGVGQGRGARPAHRHAPRSTTSRDVDIVVEAIAEDLKVKTTLFENLDEICKPGAILATTTSSLPIIECARPPAGRRTSSACTSSTRRRS